MPTIGQDCELILDGTGYYAKPGSFHMKQPRVRKATIRADMGESYVDLGPGKRTWSMVILCVNELLKYDGTPTGVTGQQYRDALRTSYAKVATTLSFTDSTGVTVNTYFDGYAEVAYDLHGQQVALATGTAAANIYEVAIALVEA